MWMVKRDKVARCRQITAPYVVGVYRYRVFAIAVAWMLAYGYWGCYVSYVSTNKP